ncbi:hypothetical protein IFR05_013168 [Cadophora sp. M221]|nr:hypothetical protein IFR05_013168 [Cadophora sp. M221]
MTFSQSSWLRLQCFDNFSTQVGCVFVGSPVPGSDDIWNKYIPANDYLNSTNTADLADVVSTRSIDNRDVGPELNADLHPRWVYCKSNPTDQGQSTLTFFDRKTDPSAIIWLFDNNCKIIGTNNKAPRSELTKPGGWALSSEKPWYMVIHHVGENLVATQDIGWWYAGEHINPVQGGLAKKWTQLYNGMHHWNDDWAFRFAFNC